MFPKIMVPPNHPFVHRVFHYFHHPFWGFSPYFWKHPVEDSNSAGSWGPKIPASQCHDGSLECPNPPL